jgi:hypothetical protein
MAEYLHPGLEAVRCRDRVVVADRLALLAHRPVAVLGPEEEAGLDDVGEHEDGLGPLGELARVGILGVEDLEGLVDVAIDLGCGFGTGRRRGRRQPGEGERHRQQPCSKSCVAHRPLS